MKKEKSCGAVISRHKDELLEILLIKHKNGGHWAFPKGHVEENETEIQTASREILEETGFVAEIDTNFRKTVTYSPARGSIKDVVYFAAKIKSGNQTAQPEEVMDIVWLTPDKAMETISFDNDKEVLSAFLKFILK